MVSWYNLSVKIILVYILCLKQEFIIDTKNNNIQTQINRIRESANSSNSIVERIKETNRQINVQKYMVLVVNFISKSEISDYIQNPSTNTQIQQIVWLLSSFISTCQEMNIIPQIICKP